MSNGSGPIIIRNLKATPGVTAEEIAFLNDALLRYEGTHKCTRGDAWRICRIFWRLLR